jgi:hypothetical protein
MLSKYIELAVNLRSVFIVMLVGLVLLLLPASLVSAEEQRCVGTLGAITVDNLRVPANRTCLLNCTEVPGNIVVGRNAALVITMANVNGNIEARYARGLTVVGNSRVNGNIQISLSRGITIRNSLINGNVQLSGNRGLLRILANQISGNVQAYNRRGRLRIAGNSINSNLQCRYNRPLSVGGNNKVGGNREHQCARL